MTLAARFALIASVVPLTACNNEPFRHLTSHGVACERVALRTNDSSDASGTLLRYWKRGFEPLGFSVSAPRVLEALYDSTGRPQVLASIDESGDSTGAMVHVLAVQFGDSGDAPIRLRIAADQAQRFDHRELRAFRRFTGPPYMTAVVARDSKWRVQSRSSVALPVSERRLARALADTLIKVGCPSPVSRGRTSPRAP